MDVVISTDITESLYMIIYAYMLIYAKILKLSDCLENLYVDT